MCVDVGLKYNQLRCLVTRGLEVEVVPWDYDFPKLAGKEYDGLFISNGPGDPAMMADTVKHIATAMEEARTPIFGICLGHQLLARAAGADTVKMKFGNRGHNIPCTNLLSGKCYITSQNHGYAVDADTLPKEWAELFVNATITATRVYGTSASHTSACSSTRRAHLARAIPNSCSTSSSRRS